MQEETQKSVMECLHTIVAIMARKYSVSKVVKIIIRKFREHSSVNMVKLSRKIAYGRPANWS